MAGEPFRNPCLASCSEQRPRTPRPGTPIKPVDGKPTDSGPTYCNNIRVLVRTRPSSTLYNEADSESCIRIDPETSTIFLQTPGTLLKGKPGIEQASENFAHFLHMELRLHRKLGHRFLLRLHEVFHWGGEGADERFSWRGGGRGCGRGRGGGGTFRRTRRWRVLGFRHCNDRTAFTGPIGCRLLRLRHRGRRG